MSHISCRICVAHQSSDHRRYTAFLCCDLAALSPAAAGLVRIIKRKLKKIQYRPHLIDGCLTATGLTIEPW